MLNNSVTQFLVIGLVTLGAILIGVNYLADNAASERRSTRLWRINSVVAHQVTEPIIPKKLAGGSLGAADRFDPLMESRLEGLEDVERITLRTADGTVVYSSENAELLGSTFAFDEDQLKILRHGGTGAGSSDPERPENQPRDADATRALGSRTHTRYHLPGGAPHAPGMPTTPSTASRAAGLIQLRQIGAGLGQQLAQQRHSAPQVIARGQLRHHAAVWRVQADLAVQRVAEQAALAVVQAKAGFVAGSFEAKDQHGARKTGSEKGATFAGWRVQQYVMEPVDVTSKRASPRIVEGRPRDVPDRPRRRGDVRGDGRNYGPSPAAIDGLAAGRHVVPFRRRDFADLTEDFEVGPGEAARADLPSRAAHGRALAHDVAGRQQYATEPEVKTARTKKKKLPHAAFRRSERGGV